MRMYLSLLAAALFSASALAQTATPLPANIVTDRAAAMQFKTALVAAFAQFDTDEDAGTDAALAADRTAIRIARLQFDMSLDTLRADATVFLHTDLLNLFNALTQLHADQAANNTAALAADAAAVATAAMQLQVDRAAVFAGLSVHGRDNQEGRSDEGRENSDGHGHG